MKEKLILPCIRGTIGDWVYYSSSMKAHQLKNWVKPAKSIKVSKKLDDYLQRDLKNRDKAISKYLFNNSHRFFNSLLIGVYGGIPDWIEFDISKKIKSLKADTAEFEELVGILVFDKDSKMFAIDGQHRVQGIIKSYKEKENNNTEYPIEDDQYSVIFLAHFDNKDGKKRTRRLFADINRKAVTIPKKDRIIIDEEDICAIVTRKIFAEYRHFKKGSLIEFESSSLSLAKNDVTHFTNLSNLYTVIQKLKPCYKKATNTNDFDEINVSALREEVDSFLDFIIKHSSELNRYFIRKTLSLAKARQDNKHILFRPIGLTLLARLYTHFKLKNELPILIKGLKYLNFIMPNSPLKNVVWSDGKILANKENQNFAFKLCLYLLNQSIKNVSNEEFFEAYKVFFKDEELELPERIIK